MRFVSPIADGADQIAAEIALDLGWELQAIVPFERGDISQYTGQSWSARALRRPARAGRPACSNCRAIPSDGLDAYVMTGRATVAHCDVLIAVWDGLPPRGRGGTGEVVQLALTEAPRSSTFPSSPGGDTRILWSAFDPVVLTVADDPTVARPLERGDVDRLLQGLLMRPARRAGAGVPAAIPRRAIAAHPRADRICAVADGDRGAAVSARGISPAVTPRPRFATNGRATGRAARRRTISARRSDRWRKRTAGRTGSRRTSRRPTAAGISSISCSAGSPCALASAPSWRRT